MTKRIPDHMIPPFIPRDALQAFVNHAARNDSKPKKPAQKKVKKLKLLKVDQTKVIWFDNLRQAPEFQSEYCFNSFSYGDAAATLVAATELINEIEGRVFRFSDNFKELLEDLRRVPKGVLVGFYCLRRNE